ncbi:hypothetical protein ALC56_15320 [Trachymyrmex septentrionalis]|uniref:Uncharacterized protein n=1 Tax=Trachymyrmex septentrionalis TaxID=34720 RepID=A0A195EQA4_9HYME|nr:hypothetical protein ALC56_15320 [Trachymyrmex septentrionalis]
MSTPSSNETRTKWSSQNLSSQLLQLKMHYIRIEAVQNEANARLDKYAKLSKDEYELERYKQKANAYRWNSSKKSFMDYAAKKIKLLQPLHFEQRNIINLLIGGINNFSIKSAAASINVLKQDKKISQIQTHKSIIEVNYVKGNKCNLLALIDTDSPVSFIQRSVCKLFFDQNFSYNVTNVQHLRALNDSQIKVIGQKEISIRLSVLPETSTRVTFQIIDNDNTKDKRAIKSIITNNSEIYRCIDMREWYERYVAELILASLEEFQERGWALSRILNLTINMNKLNSMRAGCYFEVPREITLNKAVINVCTTDNACFAWSVVAALYPAERNADRESSYPHYTTVLILAGIEFLMTLKDISKFERLNAVSINVYGIENKQVLPLRLTSEGQEGEFASDDTRVRDHCHLIGRYRGPAPYNISSVWILVTSSKTATVQQTELAIATVAVSKATKPGYVLRRSNAQCSKRRTSRTYHIGGSVKCVVKGKRKSLPLYHTEKGAVDGSDDSNSEAHIKDFEGSL